MAAHRIGTDVLRPLLIAAAGVAVYWNSFGGVFLLDDDLHINQANVREPLENWSQYVGLQSNRPVAIASFALNYTVGGYDPWGYHLVNVGIHVVNALLLYALIGRTLALSGVPERYQRTASDLAFASALIWVVHPLTTQAVTYVVQRMESLMSLWYLLALYALNRGATESRWWYGVAVVSAWLAVGTKETGMTVPAAALLYDRCYLAGSWVTAMRRRWAVYAGMSLGWVFLASFILAALTNQAVDAPAGPGGATITAGDYARSQPGVILHYLRLSAWPHPLCFDPHWPVARLPGDYVPQMVAAGALVVATLWLLWMRPRLGFLPAFALLVLSPTSSVVAIRDLMFEYRMYLPLAAVVVLAVLAADAVTRNKWVRIALLAVAVVGYGTLTVRRNEVYCDRVAMWADVVAKRPENPRAQYWLGRSLLEAGRPAEAITPYRAVVAFDGDPDSQKRLDVHHRAEAHDGLGRALAATGDDEGAVEQFRAACALNPMRAEYARHLVDALRRLGRLKPEDLDDPKNAAARTYLRNFNTAAPP